MFQRNVPIFLLLAACSDQSVGRFNAPPEAAITSHDDGAEFREGYAVELRGSASDADSQQLTATWYVGDEQVCTGAPEADGTTRCEIVFAAGDDAVTLEVRDAEGAADGDSIAIAVTPTGSPTVTLIRPDGAGPYYDDRPFDVVAEVSDEEDAPDALIVRLTSDRDGDLDVGAPDADGDVSGWVTLSAGTHVLTLTAEDTTGKTGTDSVLVDVGPPNTGPACAITAPHDGSAGVDGEVVRFEAQVSDPDVAPGLLDVSWSSDRDGALGTSTATSDGSVIFPTSALSTGTHLVTLTVADDLGLVCTDVIVYTVDTPPTVAIVSPASASTVGEGTLVTFEATVADADDPATALAIEWSSDLDGVLSTAAADAAGNAAFTTSALSAGDHTVRITVTDTNGLAASDLVVLTVNGLPSAPVVHLEPDPADTDDKLTVVVDTPSVDPEGASVSYTYAWTVDGAASSASTGSTLPASATSRGETWEVVVTPTDGTGVGPSARASVTIGNSAPSIVTIGLTPTSPKTNDTITALVTTSDADSDTVSLAYAWTVDGVAAGTGASLSGSEFARDQEVAVTVTPSDGTDVGASASASVVVANSPPTAPVLRITPASATGDDTLVCAITTASTDADGDAIAYTFDWDADGAVYPDDDVTWIGPSTTTWTDDTVPADDTEDGETWTCTVTPDDATDVGPAGVADVTLAGLDYSDLWTLDKTVSYTCAYGLVTIDFSQMLVVHSDPSISFSSTGSGSQPGTMSGTIAADTFTTSRTLPGTCTETYSFDGSFSDPNTFSGTFEAAFTGSCFGCTTRSWAVTGTR